MKVTIYSPTRNPMQSGQAKIGGWEMVFPSDSPVSVDPLMGWTGMADTTQQLKMSFTSLDEAIAYAKHNSLGYEVVEPKKRAIKPKNYAANFAFRQENRA